MYQTSSWKNREWSLLERYFDREPKHYHCLAVHTTYVPMGFPALEWKPEWRLSSLVSIQIDPKIR